MNRKNALKRRIWRRAALLLALICSLTIPQAVLATVTSSVDENGVLTVISDADDDITITCELNLVKVNGNPPGTGGSVLCDQITEIFIDGGPGDNTIDLSGVTREAFPNLSNGNVEMHGGGGNDVMTGSEFGDRMYGGDGDDVQTGGAGHDWQYGDAGDDWQVGGDGHDWQYGGDGHDYQSGGDGNDEQYGGAGWDRQYGGDGDDRQDGGDGDDLQEGGAGDDWQEGGDGNDTQGGDAGDDWQEGDAGDDTQYGGAGDDWQYGGDGNDTQEGDAGDDTQHGDAGEDTQRGGDGADEQRGGVGDDTQYGDAGEDWQYGGDGSDEQHGDAGNDVQWGNADDDEQYGGEGDDTQWGGDGDDTQWGEDGDDTQWGGAGDDTQWGGDGNDTQNGEDGNDEQYGGAGDDAGRGGEGDDTHFLLFGSADVVNDVAGDDTLDASGVTSAITIDLDLQDVDQVVDAAGNTLRLEGQFETFIGGPFPDVVSAGPLTVPRSIDGGGAPPTATLTLAGAGAQEGDLLTFDAQGLPVVDTGTTLIVEGFAPVTYTNFVTVTITNAGVDLSLGKSADPEAIIPGEPITYTFTITNAGPTTPVSATVVDTFSDAGALADVTSDGDCAWSPGSATVTCTVTSIVSGTPAHLTLGVTSSISATGVLSNTAIVTPTGGVVDVNTGNNVAGPVEITIKQPIYLPLMMKGFWQSMR